jgi:hypothetical protein
VKYMKRNIVSKGTLDRFRDTFWHGLHIGFSSCFIYLAYENLMPWSRGTLSLESRRPDCLWA